VERTASGATTAVRDASHRAVSRGCRRRVRRNHQIKLAQERPVEQVGVAVGELVVPDRHHVAVTREYRRSGPEASLILDQKDVVRARRVGGDICECRDRVTNDIARPPRETFC
jgi:hypothetical protein